jgi:hypothetical protein
VPFPFDWTKTADSEIDLSHFLDAPAGRLGALTTRDGHLATPDGKRFRGWGVNLTSTMCFPEKEQAPLIAADLARWGVNVVRFHHIDTDWGRSLIDSKRDDTRHLDAENLDRFDFLFAELKKRGIYAVLTMNIHRKFKAGDDVRDCKILGIGKGATFFNPRLIELQHEFARNLLTHQNPYTGAEYRHEPALAVVEMVNENSLVEAWCGWRLREGVTEKTDDTWQPIPDSYARELTELYQTWLTKNRTPEQIAKLRQEAGVAADAPVPRLLPKDFTPASKERFQAEAEFIMSLEADFFSQYKRLLREELGVKALLVGSNDHNDGISGYPHLRSNLLFDVIDGHGYWEHPTIGKQTRVKNTPMVNEPLDSTVVQFARSAVVGRPFTVSETNHPFPHRFATEGYPILAAYSMLHDWDGIYWFDWAQGRLAEPGSGVTPYGWFDVSTDPLKLAQLAASALMWHRQDVAPSRETDLRRYSKAEAIETLRLFKERPYFLPGFDLSTPLRKATRFTFSDAPELVADAPATPRTQDAKAPRATSDIPPATIRAGTGELTWSHADRKQGIVAIDTARTSGLIGFVRANRWREGGSTRHLAAEPENDHCAILLSALDAQPIVESTRLLLTATARTSNTGQTWEDDFQTVANWGKGPRPDRAGDRDIHPDRPEWRKGSARDCVDREGRRTADVIVAEAVEKGWNLKLGAPVASWWIIEIDR